VDSRKRRRDAAITVGLDIADKLLESDTVSEFRTQVR
jgi:hypothetical protein